MVWLLILEKNAKDNLQLLRQAKPWYLWVHLKDYPSCYGIIHSMKNQKVPASEIEKVSFWILQDFYKNKSDDAFEVRCCCLRMSACASTEGRSSGASHLSSS
jgi:hypothetical protein